MTGVEFVLTAAALAVAAGWHWLQQAPHPDPKVGLADERVWEAVHQLGLSVPFDRYWPATGRLDGVSVEVEVVRRPDGPEGPGSERELVVRIRDAVPAPLLLRREDRAASLPSEELTVGEVRFDERFRVQSRDEPTARALLDGPTRDALLAAGQVGAGFAEERLTLRAACADWTSAQVLKAVRTLVRAHLALRTRLAVVRADPRAALNEVARSDRTAGVRLRCLDHLVRAGLADRAVLLARAEDVDVSVRLLAAQALGPEGHPALERLARTGSRSVRVRAAAHLAAAGTLEPARAALVEETFLAALDDPELVRAALLGLARRGTARAVLPLRALVDGERLVGGAAPTSEVRRLADSTLAAIRSRLDASASGAVSLALDPAGDLALATAAGELSTADLPEG